MLVYNDESCTEPDEQSMRAWTAYDVPSLYFITVMPMLYTARSGTAPKYEYWQVVRV